MKFLFGVQSPAEGALHAALFFLPWTAWSLKTLLPRLTIISLGHYFVLQEGLKILVACINGGGDKHKCFETFVNSVKPSPAEVSISISAIFRACAAELN